MANYFSPIRPGVRIRVVLSSTALLPFVSVEKASAFAIAQLGVAAFFIAGTTVPVLGNAAGWFVLGAAVLASFVRAIDIENWALLTPGGLVTRAGTAFGFSGAHVATAIALIERVFLAALACVVVGQYAASVPVLAIAGARFTRFARAEDLATAFAIAVVAALWLRVRLGRGINREAWARGVWIGVAALVVTITWGVVTALQGTTTLAIAWSLPWPSDVSGVTVVDTVLSYWIGMAIALPALGGGDALARDANELSPPRVIGLWRSARLTIVFGLVITTLGTFLFSLLLSPDDQALWLSAPLAGLAQHLAGPAWARDAMSLAVACAAGLVLVPAAYAALSDAERMLYRSSAEGTLSAGLRSLHTRFGTPSRVMDVAVMAVIAVILVSGGRLPWLAHAYGIAIAAFLILAIATLVRQRAAVSATA